MMLQWIRRNALIAGGAALFVLAGLAAVFMGGGPGRTAITLDVVYDGENRQAAVSQRIDYVNAAADSLTELVFHLYPNAFGEKETAPFSARDMSLAYPLGFSPGGGEIASLLIDGKGADYAVEGTVVTVHLPKELPPGKSARVDAEYTLTLPRSDGRFGYGGHSVKLLNAFLIPAVYEGGWHRAPYTSIGDPFYSEIMDYTATLDVPEALIPSATGVVRHHQVQNGRAHYTIKAEGARDFAVVLSDQWASAQATTAGVSITAFAPDAPSAQQALDIASKAVSAYTELFGKCVYPTLQVCGADFFIGGMEYPGMAVIDRNLFELGQEDTLEFIIAHEVAHQWFYGAVGSDPVNHPWMDESLTQYATLLYYETWRGEAGLMQAYHNQIRPYLQLTSIDSAVIDRPLDEFANRYEYSAVVYAKGATMWHALRQEMGNGPFISALRGYYAQFKNKNAAPEDLLACFGGYSPLIKKWLAGEAP